MPSINKRDLVVTIANRSGLEQQKVIRVLEILFDEMTTQLAKNVEVTIRQFGAFDVKVTKGRLGRNPRKPEREIAIPPRAVVRFKPGKELREKVAQVLPMMGSGSDREE